MFISRRSRQWLILVWFVVCFVLFPLTPPISQNLTFEENMLSQFNETPAFMRVVPEATKISVPVLIPPVPWFDKERPDPCYLLLIVTFVIFLRSKIPKILKKAVLAPLKYTSDYVGIAYSNLTAK
ncbi:hypothetical protein [Paenibacillus sp. OAS669]|uniref:hypothetical protein n=1 Tax=Paenibacillus sp. OAS669 TaxID=2663821 RepID=UPI00178A6B45|nr:hypothetical protein [Paenibacillus sp. OAS669]MBE1444137.1 hypothetical protein [Paenibacillus sp. OAS669]